MGSLFSVAPVRREAPQDWSSRILVATDGRSSSEPALAAARALCGADDFMTMSICDPRDIIDGPADFRAAADIRTTRQARIAAQIRRIVGSDVHAGIRVMDGDVPAGIAAYAEASGAALLIVGIGRPRVRDRLLGDETMLRLARAAHTPMFAVTEGGVVPPRRVVIGTDFGRASESAARLAAQLANPHAELLLAHVRSTRDRHEHEGALARQADALHTEYRRHVTPVELSGDPATELLSFANLRDADAIAVGTIGTGTHATGTIGPVATRVIRCSSCSLLVAPSVE